MVGLELEEWERQRKAEKDAEIMRQKAELEKERKMREMKEVYDYEGMEFVYFKRPVRKRVKDRVSPFLSLLYSLFWFDILNSFVGEDKDKTSSLSSLWQGY